LKKKFKVGELAYTVTVVSKRCAIEVPVVHSFEYKGVVYYVIETRDTPDVILDIRDEGNLFKKDELNIPIL
jgi:hypothetical protein